MSNTHTPESNVQPQPVEDAQVAWEKYLRWLAPATAVLLLAATVFMWFQSKNDSLRVEVMQAYMLASTPEDLQAMAEGYPEEPEAPLALLQAAAMLYNDGEFESAKTQYELFQTRYGSHDLAMQAQWGIWMTQEELGDLDGAMKGFQSVKPEAELYPQAQMGQARILEKQGDTEAAKAIYTTLQNDFPDSAWAQQAKVFAQHIEQNAE